MGEFTETYRLSNKTISLNRLAGVPKPGPLNQVMIAATRHVKEDEVFVAGSGLIISALWSIQAGGRITVWTENFAEAMSLRVTCEANGIPVPEIVLDAGFVQLSERAFDQVMIHVPRGREYQQELLDLTLALLREDGRLIFAGAKNEGIRSVLGDVRARFGRAGIVSRKGGCQAGLARRPEGHFEIPTLTFEHHTLEVDGICIELCACTGVFAHDRLDQGTHNLIAGMKVAPEMRVLDLGCGTGLAGLAAAQRGSSVIWTDVSARAVESARKTLQANGVSDPEIHLCHGARAIEDQTIDAVITNPPFHQGHDINFEVSRLFVSESYRVLKPGGRIYLVANNFLPYPKWLQEHFIGVTVVQEDARFKVYRAQKPSAAYP